MFGLVNRDRLDAVVLDEFEHLIAGLSSFLLEEHEEDGTHGDITAESIESPAISLSPGALAPIGTWTPVIRTAAHFTSDSGSWTVDPDNAYVRYTKIGQTIILNVFIPNTSEITGTPEFLRLDLPEEIRFKRLHSAFDSEDPAMANVFWARGSVIGSEAIRGWVAVNSTASYDSRVIWKASTGSFAAQVDFGISGQIIYETDK